MTKSNELLHSMGYANEEADDADAQLGASAVLPTGRYRMQAKIEYNGETIEFRGITFDVYPSTTQCR